MDKYTYLKKMMDISTGRQKASLVLKGGRVVNVYTEQIETMDIAVEDGIIAGVGGYDGIENVELKGQLVCPGFIDGHIHLESSMVSPWEFERAVLPHGTTAVVTDPHEIGNVAGLQGIDYMMEATRDLRLDVFFVMPSCVPATGLDESGAVLGARELKPYYNNPRILGLAEVMNAPGVAAGLPDLLQKAVDAAEAEKVIDGHAPFLSGRDLCAYVCAGVRSDHECSDINEAMEKLARGQWIMIREGTAARNLEALMPLFEAPYYRRCLLVTDDKHPGDLISMGHIDYIIRKAVSLGADPIRAISMGTLHGAQYFGLKDRGAVAPGMRADLVVLEDLQSFRVKAVYKDGRLAAMDGRTVEGYKSLSPEVQRDKRQKLEREFPRVYDSFHMEEIRLEDFKLEPEGPMQRVIQLKGHELLTEERVVPWEENNGDVPGSGNAGAVSGAGNAGAVPEAGNAGAASGGGLAPGVSLERDIIKGAVFERHMNTGHKGLGFIGGYGLKRGAVATSVAHDSHNLIVVGTNDRDMLLAANTVRENKGGLAVAVDGVVIGQLPLPIGGIMTDASVAEVEETLEALKEKTAGLGVSQDIDAFMTLAFVSLPVIPKLRLNTYGIVDVEKQEVVAASF